MIGFERPTVIRTMEQYQGRKTEGMRGNTWPGTLVPKYQVIQCPNMAWIDLTKENLVLETKNVVPVSCAHHGMDCPVVNTKSE